MTAADKQYFITLSNRHAKVPKFGTPSSTLSGGPYFKIGKRWVGNDNPAFMQLISRQSSATNKYDLYLRKLVVQQPAETYIANSLNNKWSYQSCYSSGNFGHQGFDEAIVTRLTGEAYNTIHKKLQKDRDSYNGFEFLAEFHKAVKMIRNPAEALAGYLNRRAEDAVRLKAMSAERSARIRRSRARRSTIIQRLNREARHLSKALASLRLETQYGWKPLVSELEGIASLAYKSFPSKGAVKIFKAHRKDTTTVSFRDNVTIGDTIFDIYESRTYEYTVELKARQTYTGRYDGMGFLELLAAKGGFRINRLLPLAWELTPLSVFVDMFVNVGDILSASMAETADLSSVDRYVTRRCIIRKEIVPRAPVYGQFIVPPRNGAVVVTEKHYSREKWALGIPPLTFTIPAIGSGQSGNLLALFYNAYTKY